MKTLLSADFANIEGRVTAWLAGEDWKLAAFREYDVITGVNEKGERIHKGPDLYKVAASGIFGIPVATVDKPKRQIGKVSELALGYEGGVGAFVQMAPTYGLKIADHFEAIMRGVSKQYWNVAETKWMQQEEMLSKRWNMATYVPAEAIKLAWRAKHPKTVALWKDLINGAIEAVRNPGKMVSSAFGKLKWRTAGSFLWLQLPSKRTLCYPYPRLKEKYWCNVDGAEKGVVLSSEEIDVKRRKGHKVKIGQPTYELRYKCVNSFTRKWEETGTYGGSLCENSVQAIARDVMADAMLRLDGDYPIVLTVHDELVSEVPVEDADLDDYEKRMAIVPAWAIGLPVAVEGWVGERYRK